LLRPETNIRHTGTVAKLHDERDILQQASGGRSSLIPGEPITAADAKHCVTIDARTAAPK
jgi:hypothetical protein